jgi:5-methylthioadenosine/S-adenosylhomocysteine deaminase
VEYLQSLGVFEVDTYLAHCVHLDARDFDILAHTGTTVVHNPSSNCKLASGIAPVARMRQAGISLALGTDGAASNNSLDLFQEIRLAGMISAVSTGSPVALKAYDILHMATAGGAQALGRLQECGTLEVGKDADIILIDTHTPHLTPLNNPFSALVYAAKSTDVDTVFCQGRKLMDHRVLLTIDEEAVLRTADSIWRNIIART